MASKRRASRTVGRPSLYNEELAKNIVLMVRTGTPLTVAAQSQGIGRSTFFDWMRRGEVLGEDPFVEFSDRVRRAEAESHTVLVGVVRESAVQRGNWQAAMAMLRMRWPEHYAERIEHSGPGGGPIAMEIAQALEGLKDDELASIERFLAESAARGPAPADQG
jgi:transposase